MSRGLTLLSCSLIFTAGIAVGSLVDRPWWQTCLVGGGSMLLVGSAIDWLFSDKEGRR